MTIPNNSRRYFLAKSVLGAAALAANPLKKCFAISEETTSGDKTVSGTKLTVDSQANAESGVKIIEAENKVTVEINGKLFTEYRYKEKALKDRTSIQ